MDELELLHKQISELQLKAKELAEKKREPIIEELKAKIKMYGITAKELGFASSEKKMEDKKSFPVAIKYRDGDNTWTGRGRKPKWVEEKLAQGSKLEDFATV